MKISFSTGEQLQKDEDAATDQIAIRPGIELRNRAARNYCGQGRILRPQEKLERSSVRL